MLPRYIKALWGWYLGKNKHGYVNLYHNIYYEKKIQLHETFYATGGI